MNIIKLAACVVSLTLSAGSLHGKPLVDGRLQSAFELLRIWLEAQRDYEQIPGMSVAVVHDQEIIFKDAFGYAHPKSKTPATPKTMYSICSISKLFTAIAVMQLRDRGLLRLDDPVQKHLPWFSIQQSHPKSPPITIEGLITHSSGLPREAAFPYWSAPGFIFPTHEQLVQRLSSQKTLYPACKTFQYSNLGMAIAGSVIAQAAGMPYERYVQENIFTPLNLHDTSTDLPEKEINKRLASGHSALSRKGIRHKTPFFQTKAIAPAAGFASTVEDLARFAAWQFRLLHGGKPEVLETNTLAKMHRVHWTDPDWEVKWGLGFSVQSHNQKIFVGHQGVCPGYRSALMLQTEEKIGIIVLANALGVDTGRYAQNIYAIVAPAILEKVNRPETAPRIDPIIRRYTGIFDDQPWGGEQAFFIWNNKLGALSFPTDHPLDEIETFEYIEKNTFKRLRKDGSFAEEITFELGPDGTPKRVWRNHNFSNRLR